MYAGLFLMIPLLNLIWSGCRSKRQHVLVLVTMVFLTFLPSTVNSLADAGYDLLPSYFTQIYYVTYYFAGCFIRTYRPKAKPEACLLGAGALSVLTGVLNVLTRTDPENFYSGFSPGYSSLWTAFITVLIFLSLYGIRTQRPKIRKAAAFFSGLVFEVYLLSFLFDKHIYVLHYGEYPMSLYLPVGFLMVGSVFVLSVLSAYPVNRLSRIFCRRILKSRRKDICQDVKEAGP